MMSQQVENNEGDRRGSLATERVEQWAVGRESQNIVRCIGRWLPCKVWRLNIRSERMEEKELYLRLHASMESVVGLNMAWQSKTVPASYPVIQPIPGRFIPKMFLIPYYDIPKIDKTDFPQWNEWEVETTRDRRCIKCLSYVGDFRYFHRFLSKRQKRVCFPCFTHKRALLRAFGETIKAHRERGVQLVPDDDAAAVAEARARIFDTSPEYSPREQLLPSLAEEKGPPTADKWHMNTPQFFPEPQNNSLFVPPVPPGQRQDLPYQLNTRPNYWHQFPYQPQVQPLPNVTNVDHKNLSEVRQHRQQMNDRQFPRMIPPTLLPPPQFNNFPPPSYFPSDMPDFPETPVLDALCLRTAGMNHYSYSPPLADSGYPPFPSQ